MIAYEELSAALERYRARTRGEAAPPAAAPHHEPHTAETTLPPDTAQHMPLGGDEEQTQVGGLDGAAPPRPISDEHSNELDIQDVLSDEEVH